MLVLKVRPWCNTAIASSEGLSTLAIEKRGIKFIFEPDGLYFEKI
jgi:hypothetical protein